MKVQGNGHGATPGATGSLGAPDRRAEGPGHSAAAAESPEQSAPAAAGVALPGAGDAKPENRPAPPPEDSVFQALLTEMGGDPDTTTLREIARTAVPLPGRAAEAYREWREIMARRAGEGPLFPNPVLFRLYQLRAELLEEMALSSLPVLDPADAAARLRLLQDRLNGPERRIDPQQLGRVLDALAGELETLADASAAPAGAGTLRTATERRAAVIGHLCDPELSRWSDRAIARACGVSPQTVGNWRRKLSDDSGQGEGDSSVRLFMRDGRTHEMETRHIGAPLDEPSQI